MDHDNQFSSSEPSVLMDWIHFCKLKINPSGLIAKSNVQAEATASLPASVARENG